MQGVHFDQAEQEANLMRSTKGHWLTVAVVEAVVEEDLHYQVAAEVVVAAAVGAADPHWVVVAEGEAHYCEWVAEVEGVAQQVAQKLALGEVVVQWRVASAVAAAAAGQLIA